MKIEFKTQRLEPVPLELKYLESTHSHAGNYEKAQFMMFLPNDSAEEKTYMPTGKAVNIFMN